MKIKKGDSVVIIAGKDRGRSGTVLRAFPKKEHVLIEGIGMIKKHQKAARRGQAGQIIGRPTRIHVSNVAIQDIKTSKPARVGYRIENGEKMRVSKRSGEKL